MNDPARALIAARVRAGLVQAEVAERMVRLYHRWSPITAMALLSGSMESFINPVSG